VIATAVLLSGLPAGCGGASHGSSSSHASSSSRASSTSTEEQEFQKSLKAAACMRANGVLKYPDPKLIGGSIFRNLSPGLNLDPGSPTFQRAAKKCADGQPELVGPG
jgi:hypothetical protein